MKNIKYIICSMIAGSILLTSCEKFLTIDSPTGITDDKWWNTEKNAYDALGTIYAGIPGGTSGRNIMYYSGMSDEAVHRGEFKGNYDGFTRGLADSRWGVASHLWNDNYLCIRRANRFLENVDKAFMDEVLKTRMKYEARALRAYYHMELMMVFGDIPLIDRSISPNENYLERTGLETVKAFVFSELRECAANLPDVYDNTDNWRMSSGVCLALLARAAMYYGAYDEVKAAAKEVIDSKVYELWKNNSDPSKSFLELFGYAGELNKERIFFKANGASNAWVTFAPFGIGGEVYLSPTNTVVDNFETKQGKTIYELGADSLVVYRKNPNYKNNRDPRLSASVFIPGENFQNKYILDPFANPSDMIGATKSTATGYWVKKYVHERDQQSKNGTLDYMVVRYAEVLLNYVEALVESGEWQHEDVVKYLNELRNRVGMPNVDTNIYNSQSKIRELVRRERQAELAFEGGRYFDIRRWGIADVVMNGTVYGATNPTTGEIVTVQNRTYNPEREYLWPIPETEIIANPNTHQNPKY